MRRRVIVNEEYTRYTTRHMPVSLLIRLKALATKRRSTIEQELIRVIAAGLGQLEYKERDKDDASS